MMQKMMNAAAAQGDTNPAIDPMAANLEINPKHDVVIKLRGMVAESSGEPNSIAKQYAELIFDVAAISTGYELTDPATFSKRVIALMGNGLTEEEQQQEEEKKEAVPEEPTG